MTLGKLMISKEHGSWAMLAVPFLVGLGVRNFPLTIPVVLSALLGLSVFLARYPLALMLRFPARRNACKSSLYVYGALSVVLLIPLLAVYRMYLLLGFGLFAAGCLGTNLWLTVRGKERSVPANLLGIAGLAVNAPVAYYAAGGQWGLTPVMLWAVCSGFFWASMFYVKMIFRESQNAFFREVALTVHLVILLGAVAAAQAKLVPSLLPLAFVLPVLKVVVAISRNSAVSLKKVGFVELAHSAAFLVLVLLSFYLYA